MSEEYNPRKDVSRADRELQMYSTFQKKVARTCGTVARQTASAMLCKRFCFAFARLCEAFTTSTVFKHFQGFAEVVRKTALATEAVDTEQVKEAEKALTAAEEKYDNADTFVALADYQEEKRRQLLGPTGHLAYDGRAFWDADGKVLPNSCRARVSIEAYSRFQAWQRQRRQVRVASLQRLARKWLGEELVASGREGDTLDAGSDGSVASALSAVCHYEAARKSAASADLCTPPSAADFCPAAVTVVPGPSALLRRVGLQEEEAPDSHAEDLLCADARRWLRSAAAGVASTEELAGRQNFYRQLLMRPEEFGEDPDFFALLAVLCDRLEELSGRLSAKSRDCASQLGRVLQIGRELLETLLPILVVSICNAVSSNSLPLLSIEALLNSLQAFKETPATAESALGSLWRKDCGRMLEALLQSPHFRDFWHLRGGPKESPGRPAFQLTDMWLQFRHAWDEALVDQSSALPEASGIHDLFRPSCFREVQQCYLDLYKHLDNFITFLSMVTHYRRLANIAGDAGMYHLRTSLHHLLQEIEMSMAQITALSSRVMQDVRKMVLNLMSDNAKGATGRNLVWLERLQLVDEASIGKSCKALLEALQDVRYMSSEAYLPQLKQSALQSLQVIGEITASAEFRSRCAEAPPAAFAPEMLAGLADASPDASPASDAAPSPSSPEPAEDLPPPAPATGATPAVEAQVADLPQASPETGSHEGITYPQAGRECSQEEEDRFYELLFAAVLPLLGDGVAMPSSQVRYLLEKTGLSSTDFEDDILGPADSEAMVDAEAIRHLLQKAAKLQAKQPPDLPATRLPWIDGLRWDGKRVRIDGSKFHPI
ncbi:scrn3 [Symbiodinium sp. CCMP2592]|nr:scrn3 [Symbiodinium sp. CCMP2592]